MRALFIILLLGSTALAQDRNIAKMGGVPVPDMIDVPRNSLKVSAVSGWSGGQITGGVSDIIDRTSRLLGVVYGSQGQQLQQSATNFNLFTELRAGGTAYDARQIRLLTSGDVVSAVQSGAWNLGSLSSITNPITVNTHAVSQSGAWTVSGSGTFTVGGTVTANQGGAPWSINLNQYTPLSGRLPVDGSGVTQPVSLASVPTHAVTQSGTWNVGTVTSITNPVPVTGTFWQATQPVSGTVTANAGSGTFTISGTVSQGAPSSTANRWPVQLTDGTNSVGTAGNGTGLTVTCTNCGGAVEGQTYFASVFASAAAASKDHLNIFNASGSGKIIKIRAIRIAPEFAGAVTGLAQSFRLSRYTTDGATCTSITIALTDTTNTVVPAQVTAKTNCTTDPTVLTDLMTCAASGDETHAMNNTPCYRYESNGGQAITLREGQGLIIKSSALSGAFPVTITIEFTM